MVVLLKIMLKTHIALNVWQYQRNKGYLALLFGLLTIFG